MIVAIVLAGGMSKRLGVTKQLLEYEGKPIICHVVQNLINSRVGEIIVVVGSRGQEVSKVLVDLPVKVVFNDHYADGQSTSVIKGIQALDRNLLPKGVLFALGDMPLLKSKTINQLIEQFELHGGIIVPFYKDKPGNPVIFDIGFLDDFESLSGDIGARNIIKLHEDQVHRVEVEDEGVTFDIDTWNDYNKLIGLKD